MLTVELVESNAPVTLGVVGGSVSARLPAGEGPASVPILLFPPALTSAIGTLLLGRCVLRVRQAVRSRPHTV